MNDSKIPFLMTRKGLQMGELTTYYKVFRDMDSASLI